MGESEFQRREAPLPNPDTNGVSLNPTLTLGTEDAENQSCAGHSTGKA